MLVAFYDGEAAQMSSVVRIRYAVKFTGPTSYSHW